MSADYGSFFTDKVEDAMDDASFESVGGNRLEFAGKYLMRVTARKYKKDNEIHAYPNVKITEKSKSLQLNFIFEVVDGTEQVPEGTYEYGSLILAPAAGASDKKVKDTMKFLKPRLGALIGKEEMEGFKFNKEWVDKNLLADFTKDGEDYVVKRNHKMTKLVMVEFEAEVYNGKVKLNIKDIKPAKDGDHSVTIGKSIKEREEVPADSSSSDMDAIDALAGGEVPDGVAEIDVF